MSFLNFLQPNIKRMSEKKDISGLIKALSHSNYKVRIKSIRALTKLIGEKAIEYISLSLNDANYKVQIEAINALADLKAIEPLISILKDGSIRWRVLSAIESIGNPKAIEPLEELLSKIPEYVEEDYSRYEPNPYSGGTDWIEDFVYVPNYEYTRVRETIEKLEKLQLGKILYNFPSIMKVGEKERIEIRITRQMQKKIMNGLKGRGFPKIEIIKTSTFMKVRLSGKYFEIIPLNEEDQIVGNDQYTEWSYDVMPKKAGIQILHLHVTVRIKIPNGEEKRDHPVFDKEVKVKVNPLYSIKKFISNHWKWIITVIVIPLIVWIIKSYLIK